MNLLKVTDLLSDIGNTYSIYYRSLSFFLLTWCSGPASFNGKNMSRWPFLVKHLSYSPVTPINSLHTWRESADPTFSNSLDAHSGVR